MFNIDEFIKDHKSNYINYFEAIIFPDGHVEYSIPSHTHKLMMIWGVPVTQIYGGEKYDELQKLIPVYASPLHWLCNKTNCVVCWYEQSVFPFNYTQEQVDTFNKLISSGCVYREDGGDISISIEDFVTDEQNRCNMNYLNEMHNQREQKLAILEESLLYR